MALGKKIAFLGSGNMAEAIVKGLLAAGTAPEGAVFLWKAAGGELVRRLRTRSAR